MYTKKLEIPVELRPHFEAKLREYKSRWTTWGNLSDFEAENNKIKIFLLDTLLTQGPIEDCDALFNEILENGQGLFSRKSWTNCVGVLNNYAKGDSNSNILGTGFGSLESE